MKAVVLGANGQLGSDLIRIMDDWEAFPLTHMQVDICDVAATRNVLMEIKPDMVINSAAFTRVDDCEDQPEKAFQVNTYAVRQLAQCCAALDAVLVHISTDYVFGGDKRTPYTTDDAPNPLNVYGVSKLAGEYFMRTLCPRHFIIRSSGLYGVTGSSGKGGNFVETMLRLAKESKAIRVVNDQVLTPTYTKDLACKLKELVQTVAYGMYHITNAGACSWYEFAQKIFELTRLIPDFGPTTTAAYGAKARRPAYSVLADNKLNQLGLDELRSWPKALKAYLQEKGHVQQGDGQEREP